MRTSSPGSRHASTTCSLATGDALTRAISRSCELKAAVVASDEKESGLRAILNFGHTFGHAIEAGTGYGTWLHGEAVGCGMVLAAELSQRLGLIDAAVARRVAALVERAGLPVRLPPLAAAELLALMGHDKKAEGGAPRFILLDALGHARIAPVDASLRPGRSPGPWRPPLISWRNES